MWSDAPRFAASRLVPSEVKPLENREVMSLTVYVEIADTLDLQA
jgi:hypothetical protein